MFITKFYLSFDSCGDLFSSLLEIEGYAKFNAIFDFWESVVGLLLCFIFIILFSPSLFALTLFNCFFSTTTTAYYMYMTLEKRGMFNSYIQGIVTPIQAKVRLSLIFFLIHVSEILT